MANSQMRPEALDSYMVEDEAAGIYRVHRRMFTDPRLFDIEMQHIFEGGWIYLAHEDQVAENNDFLTTNMGRQPVILCRQADGSLVTFLNACQHRGALLEAKATGNKKLFICPFHAWSYSSTGRLVSCGDVQAAGYGSGFDKNALGLKRVARTESYRGLIFASMSETSGSLWDYLGDAKVFIDLIVDQSCEGAIEIIPGRQSYTYDGNWKLQVENGVDGYHIGVIHGNYVSTINNRAKAAAGGDFVKPTDVSAFSKFPGGYYAFKNGHVVMWNEVPNPTVKPSYANHDYYVATYGEERAKWMVNTVRNLFIFPNLFLMDQMSTQIRVIHPLSVDKTEVRTYAFAPKGETPDKLASRIRQYEDFFNASGLATPDDLAAFNASQAGFAARGAEWNDISRGAVNMKFGADDRARRLGFEPVFYGNQLQDEGLYVNQHRRWLQMLREGLSSRPVIAEEVEAAA